MDYGDYYWGLYSGYYGDPFPQSPGPLLGVERLVKVVGGPLGGPFDLVSLLSIP